MKRFRQQRFDLLTDALLARSSEAIHEFRCLGQFGQRFRNEFVLEGASTLGKTPLRPYIEEEFFYSAEQSRFEANWLGAGLAWRPADGVKLKIGYRWNRFRVGDEWRDRDVLVTGINLFF